MSPLLITAVVLACICALWTGTGEAKGKTVRLTHVASAVTEIEGRTAMRIEIETNRPEGLSYTLSERYHAENQLLVELENVEVHEQFPQQLALDGTIGKKLVLVQREKNRAALRIYAAQSLAREDAFRIYTVPGDPTAARCSAERCADTRSLSIRDMAAATRARSDTRV